MARARCAASLKLSPPFEGGVVGTIDYQIFTVFYFPTGVVDF
jgi:hypothetical protein